VCRVVLRADPEEAEVEHAYGAGEHALARKLRRRRDVARHAAAHTRQRLAEAHHRIELLPVAVGSPTLVVEVLLASGGVGASCLQMAE
jgi:hypothetical protein